MLSTKAGLGRGRLKVLGGRSRLLPPAQAAPRPGEKTGTETTQAGKSGERAAPLARAGLRVRRRRPGGDGAPAGGMRPGRGLSAPDGPRRGGLRERRAAAAGPGRGAAGARAAGPRRAAGRRARPRPRPLAWLPRRAPAAPTPGRSAEAAARVRGARGARGAGFLGPWAASLGSASPGRDGGLRAQLVLARGSL